ncbi:MAG: hypothetical protein CW716_04700 [Candidatus Bathyarchaeum sp.]|nr:MAG: hypothetical protein CW716_04700 [Candidatus Bathyarchaeum sp.]
MKTRKLASPIVSGAAWKVASGTATTIFAVGAFGDGFAFISVLPLLLAFSEVLILCSVVRVEHGFTF